MCRCVAQRAHGTRYRGFCADIGTVRMVTYCTVVATGLNFESPVGIPVEFIPCSGEAKRKHFPRRWRYPMRLASGVAAPLHYAGLWRLYESRFHRCDLGAPFLRFTWDL